MNSRYRPNLTCGHAEVKNGFSGRIMVTLQRVIQKWCGAGEEGRVTCGGGVGQVGHAVARALEVSLHAAAVSDCFQGT